MTRDDLSCRVAPFDPSVILLQNEAGRAKWPVTKSKLRLLREAFKPKLDLNPHSLAFAGRDKGNDSDDDLPDGCEQPSTSGAAPTAEEISAAVAAGTRREGDWDCPSCGRLVFAKKSVCGKCKSARPGGEGGTESLGGAAGARATAAVGAAAAAARGMPAATKQGIGGGPHRTKKKRMHDDPTGAQQGDKAKVAKAASGSS